MMRLFYIFKGVPLATAFARLEGWPEVLKACCPVVLATPLALARWLPYAAVFETLAMDDAHRLSRLAAVAALARLARFGHVLCAAESEDAPNARDDSAMALLRERSSTTRLRNSFIGRAALPSQLRLALGDEAQVSLQPSVASGAWREERCGTTLADVANLLARCRGLQRPRVLFQVFIVSRPSRVGSFFFQVLYMF